MAAFILMSNCLTAPTTVSQSKPPYMRVAERVCRLHRPFVAVLATYSALTCGELAVYG